MQKPPGSQTQNAIVGARGTAHISINSRWISAGSKGSQTMTPFNLIGIASVLALGIITLLVSVI